MEKFRVRLEQANAHIRCCCNAFWYQLNNGKQSLHEHPWTARSWVMEELQELRAHPGVQLVQAHMCSFGMTAPEGGRHSQHLPVKKPTGFLTSSTCIAQELEKKCTDDHKHAHLISGKAAAAQVYPTALCEAILNGVIKQKRADDLGRIGTGKMSRGGVAAMVRDICRGGDTAEKDVQKAARRVMSMATTRETLRPKGEWPEHWKDEMHEPDGGSDSRGIRPQVGCDLLKKEMHMLNCRNGVEYAEDDVVNNCLTRLY